VKRPEGVWRGGLKSGGVRAREEKRGERVTKSSGELQLQEGAPKRKGSYFERGQGERQTNFREANHSPKETEGGLKAGKETFGNQSHLQTKRNQKFLINGEDRRTKGEIKPVSPEGPDRK